MTQNFTISVGQIDRTIAIMREVAQWCIDTGKETWKLEELTHQKLMNGLTEDNFYLGKMNGDDACCMILQWYDPLFWPDLMEFEAGYIHKLCVKREFAGLRLSENMVESAVKECHKRNVPYLRLDTGLHKKVLCNLYESLGFTKVGETTNYRGEFALYETKIF